MHIYIYIYIYIYIFAYQGHTDSAEDQQYETQYWESLSCYPWKHCLWECVYIYIYMYIYIYIYELHTISFQTFFVWALLLIVHIWNSRPLQSNLLQLQCTCCTVQGHRYYTDPMQRAGKGWFDSRQYTQILGRSYEQRQEWHFDLW